MAHLVLSVHFDKTFLRRMFGCGRKSLPHQKSIFVHLRMRKCSIRKKLLKVDMFLPVMFDKNYLAVDLTEEKTVPKMVYVVWLFSSAWVSDGGYKVKRNDTYCFCFIKAQKYSSLVVSHRSFSRLNIPRSGLDKILRICFKTNLLYIHLQQ